MNAIFRWGVILIGAFFAMSFLFQVWQLYRFVNSGPRFTAHDGQELCQVVREIARHSYGFQHSGMKMPECHYIQDQR